MINDDSLLRLAVQTDAVFLIIRNTRLPQIVIYIIFPAKTMGLMQVKGRRSLTAFRLDRWEVLEAFGEYERPSLARVDASNDERS